MIDRQDTLLITALLKCNDVNFVHNMLFLPLPPPLTFTIGNFLSIHVQELLLISAVNSLLSLFSVLA